jgi:hypothetical protein
MRFIFSHILAAVLLAALSSAPAAAKTSRACIAEYAREKAALKAAGKTKAEFLDSCRQPIEAAAPVASDANPYQQQYVTDRRVCPPGSHPEISAVSANGYWCVMN